MSIYDRQYGVKQLDIDCKGLSPFVSTNCKGYNTRGVSSKCKHIKGYDMYDKCKVATALRWRKYKKCKAIVQPQCKHWYIISVNNGEYQCKVKENHLLTKCKELRQQGVEFSVKQM